MKTIVDMAEEYAKAYGSSTEQCVAERAYEYGANDALGEILHILNNPWEGKEDNWLVALPTLLRNKIEDLRNYD